MYCLTFTEVSEVCQLLGCSDENLSGALTQRTIEVKKEWVKTDFTVAGVSKFLVIIRVIQAGTQR